MGVMKNSYMRKSSEEKFTIQALCSVMGKVILLGKNITHFLEPARDCLLHKLSNPRLQK